MLSTSVSTPRGFDALGASSPFTDGLVDDGLDGGLDDDY